MEHEKSLGRDDLILPIYFVTAPVLERTELLKDDALASEIGGRQRYDWRIQADLPETHRMRILICEQEGIPVASVVASVMGDSAIYVLGATSDKGLDAKGSYLLQWTLIQWLKERGVRRYDLGGIDPQQNPGVYHFKRGLSGADVCQLSPLVACENTVSSAVVQAGLVARRMMRKFKALV